MLEAPCAGWRETLSLRRRCPCPIVVDELAQHDDDLALVLAQDCSVVWTMVGVVAVTGGPSGGQMMPSSVRTAARRKRAASKGATSTTGGRPR